MILTNRENQRNGEQPGTKQSMGYCFPRIPMCSCFLPLSVPPVSHERASESQQAATHSAASEFADFDSEFALEPRGDQVAMTPRAAGFDLPAARRPLGAL